jgi:ribosomal protein S18 acetylase RimI-like enzyme
MDGEPAYLQIVDSEWNTPNSYVVVHRLCVALDARREGVAVRMMRYAADVAREAGIRAFRIDTHSGNIRMLSMLEKLGFAYCGIVHYDSGERLAYDLDLDLSNVL